MVELERGRLHLKITLRMTGLGLDSGTCYPWPEPSEHDIMMDVRCGIGTFAIEFAKRHRLFGHRPENS